MLSQIHKHKQYKYRELATNTTKYMQQTNQSDCSISVQVIIIARIVNQNKKCPPFTQTHIYFNMEHSNKSATKIDLIHLCKVKPNGTLPTIHAVCKLCHIFIYKNISCSHQLRTQRIYKDFLFDYQLKKLNIQINARTQL